LSRAEGPHRGIIAMVDAETQELSDRLARLREELRAFLRFEIGSTPAVEPGERHEERGYVRTSIRYPSPDGDSIPAHLLTPPGDGPFPAVLVHHQHNSEHWLGKSEPAGLAGDPLQAFGPTLSRRGVVVLAPDSIGFEDRRRHAHGVEPHPADGPRHHNELTYRLLQGDTLMRKVLADSASALSALAGLSEVDAQRIGMLGHSFGGNTVLFHAPLDDRVRFACASGAAASYGARMTLSTGIELAQVIPGFLERFEIHDLVACMAPRPLLLVSATGDPYSVDADAVEAAARPAYRGLAAGPALEHARFEGGHALTAERFGLISGWIIAHAQR
jgi:dienelactone hydrolase